MDSYRSAALRMGRALGYKTEEILEAYKANPCDAVNFLYQKFCRSKEKKCLARNLRANRIFNRVFDAEVRKLLGPASRKTVALVYDVCQMSFRIDRVNFVNFLFRPRVAQAQKIVRKTIHCLNKYYRHRRKRAHVLIKGRILKKIRAERDKSGTSEK
jgi:hypothetical protein